MKKARLKSKTSAKNEESGNFSLASKIVLAIILLVLLVGFYFLTVYLLKNKKTEEPEIVEEFVKVRETNAINYSDIDNIKEDSYYVLFTKEDDESNDTYDLYINTLTNNNLSDKFYYIELKGDNKDLLSDKESLKKLDEIKVKSSTLIYVKDGKIEDNYVGSEKILKHLSSLLPQTSNK